MAEAERPSLVKLVIGAIFDSEGILIEAQKKLVRRFGPLDFKSSTILFNFTEYYKEEMGDNLKRQFLSFRKLIMPEQLPRIKLYTNRLEKRLSRQKGRPSRRINLDPGYISASKLVLASCKNFSHRIYLDKGVYAEVTLHFKNKTFMPWPWTYPDYKTEDYIQNFNTIRKIYLRQLSNSIFL